ncbi:hypothetical protein NXV15_24010 [Bacteroides thetaiotaomicron]|nr:hypothetical protein [Bacteroides thetaiotaomicron]MCS2687408.1 hypothetical protein [Bacteroides thetaiotaomicron]
MPSLYVHVEKAILIIRGNGIETEEEESNPDIVSQGWTTADNFGSLPDYIHIYKSPENLAGKKAIAYIAVADMSKAKFEVLGDIAFSQEANGYGDEIDTYPFGVSVNLPKHR